MARARSQFTWPQLIFCRYGAPFERVLSNSAFSFGVEIDRRTYAQRWRFARSVLRLSNTDSLTLECLPPVDSSVVILSYWLVVYNPKLVFNIYLCAFNNERIPFIHVNAEYNVCVKYKIVSTTHRLLRCLLHSVSCDIIAVQLANFFISSV